MLFGDDEVARIDSPIPLTAITPVACHEQGSWPITTKWVLGYFYLAAHITMIEVPAIRPCTNRYITLITPEGCFSRLEAIPTDLP